MHKHTHYRASPGHFDNLTRQLPTPRQQVSGILTGWPTSITFTIVLITKFILLSINWNPVFIHWFLETSLWWFLLSRRGWGWLHLFLLQKQWQTMNGKVFPLPPTNGLITLPMFQPECTGLLQGEDGRPVHYSCQNISLSVCQSGQISCMYDCLHTMWSCWLHRFKKWWQERKNLSLLLNCEVSNFHKPHYLQTLNDTHWQYTKCITLTYSTHIHTTHELQCMISTFWHTLRSW